jgi:hypothetical protein
MYFCRQIFYVKHIYKTIFTLCLFTFLSKNGISQSIERSVLATAGGQGQSSTAFITWTAGELVTATLQGGSNTLTQGFQQGSVLHTTDVNSLAIAGLQVKVYPVPTVQDVTIETAYTLNKKLSYTVYNSFGSVICSGNIKQASTHIDLSLADNGAYYIYVSDEESKLSQTIKIIKTN